MPPPALDLVDAAPAPRVDVHDAGTVAAPPAVAGPAAPVPATAARRRGARLARRAGRLLLRSSGLVAVLAFWQLGSTQDWFGATTPSPAEVWRAGHQLVQTGDLQHHLWVSLGRVTKGLTLGIAIGLVLGLAAGLVRTVEDVINAPIVALRMLPNLALVPIFIIWFGIGETPKIALITSGPIFAIYINVLHGIRGVDQRFVESARSCGVSRFGLVRQVVLPGALPQIFIGLRAALGIGWLSLVVAEQTATTSGVGFLMSEAREFLRTDVIFVILAVYAVLGVVTDLAVRGLELRALAWRRGFAGT